MKMSSSNEVSVKAPIKLLKIRLICEPASIETHDDEDKTKHCDSNNTVYQIQLMSFPGGRPAQLSGVGVVRMSIHPHTKDSRKNVLQLEQRKSHTHTIFKGRCALHSPHIYAVAHLNSQTQSAIISRVAGVFEMRRVDGTTVDVNNSDKEIPTEVNYGEKRRQLIEEFGSHTTKRRMHSAQLSQVNVEQSGSAGAISLALEGGIEAANSMIVETKREFLPMHDLHTNEASKIYPISSIMDPQQEELIDASVLLKMMKKSSLLTRNENQYSDFLLACVPGLSTFNGDRTKQKRMARLAMYTNYLVQLAQLGRQWIKDGAYLSTKMSIPLNISNELLLRFRECSTSSIGTNRFVESEASKARILCYICVAMLHIFSQQIPQTAFVELAKSVKLSDLQLCSYMKQVGAKIKRNGGDVVVTLSAPLVLPADKMKGRRGA